MLSPKKAIELDGVSYYSATEVLKVLNISRQTLYKWRQDGRIPVGHRFRGRQLLFSEVDWKAILEHAHRIEPALPTETNQLRLFTRPKGA